MITFAHRMDLFTEHFFAGLNARRDEGSPDLPPAPHIIEALGRAASRSDTHSYQPHRGFAELRQAGVEMYQRAYGVSIDPESEVLPLLGSKEGIFHLPLAFVDPGSVVLVPEPGYITYTRGARLAGGGGSFFPFSPERGF